MRILIYNMKVVTTVCIDHDVLVYHKKKRTNVSKECNELLRNVMERWEKEAEEKNEDS